MLNEGNQIHNFISSSGSNLLTSYGSGSTSQKKFTVPMVPVPVPQRCLSGGQHSSGILLAGQQDFCRALVLSRLGKRAGNNELLIRHRGCIQLIHQLFAQVHLSCEHGEEGLVAGNLCPLGAGQLVLQPLRRGRLDALLAVEDVLVPVQCSVLRILIFVHRGSRIQKTATKERSEKKICCPCLTFYCSHKNHKVKNYINFKLVKKKKLGQFT